MNLRSYCRGLRMETVSYGGLTNIWDLYPVLTMKLVVFSDVHGNLEALDLFMEHSVSLGADLYVCLGDMIGYGPNPNECLEKIKNLAGENIVMGNHEWAALNLEDSAGYMNPMAYDAIVWTRRALTGRNLEFIDGLPEKIEMGQFTFVHSSAFRPLRWEYLFVGKSLGIALCLRHSNTRITFVGHTHRPMIADQSGRSLLEKSLVEDGTTFADNGEGKILINPGSLGQPRENSAKPCYVLIDTDANLITWRRLHGYDPGTTARKILATDLPVECAYYLIR